MLGVPPRCLPWSLNSYILSAVVASLLWSLLSNTHTRASSPSTLKQLTFITNRILWKWQRATSGAKSQKTLGSVSCSQGSFVKTFKSPSGKSTGQGTGASCQESAPAFQLWTLQLYSSLWMTAAPDNILTLTSGETLSWNHQPSCSWISDTLYE